MESSIITRPNFPEGASRRGTPTYHQDPPDQTRAPFPSKLNRGQDTFGLVTTPDAPAHANATAPPSYHTLCCKKTHQVTRGRNFQFDGSAYCVEGKMRLVA